MKVPKGMGFEGKPTGFLCTVAPYYEPGYRRTEREKGKQIQASWPKPGVYFGKLEYKAEAYVEGAKSKDVPRKFGFGSNKPLDFDDLGSTIEVGRYRHHLMLEEKQMSKRSPSPPRNRNADGSMRSTNRPQDAPTVGLGSTIPRFTSAFDRMRHVQEFSTRKIPAHKKYERQNLSMRSTSQDIGEGCEDKSLLKPPEHGVGNFVLSMMSKVHPYVSGGKMTIGN